MNDLIALLSAYLLGCLSTAYYLVRWRCGVDVRTVGSGNAGATNAGRLLGPWGFVVTFIGDMGKGMAVVLLARWLTDSAWIVALVIPAAVAGHIWPLQLGLRGGEGFATALGALLVYDLQLTGILGGMALLLYVLTRKRSATGAVVLLTTPLLAWLTGGTTAEVAALLALIGMMLWAFRRHLPNFIAHRKLRT